MPGVGPVAVRSRGSTMDKQVANGIIEQALRVGDRMNRLAEAVEKIVDLEEKKRFRSQFAEIEFSPHCVDHRDLSRYLV